MSGISSPPGPSRAWQGTQIVPSHGTSRRISSLPDSDSRLRMIQLYSGFTRGWHFMARISPGRSIGLLALSWTLLLSARAADNDTAATWKASLLTWRADLAKELQEPDGWLTLIGLEWLKPGDNSFGSANGNALIVQAPVSASLG